MLLSAFSASAYCAASARRFYLQACLAKPLYPTYDVDKPLNPRYSVAPLTWSNPAQGLSRYGVACPYQGEEHTYPLASRACVGLA